MTGLYLHPNTKQEIIDTAEEDIIVTNHLGIIIKASQISGRHYGIDAKDLLGKSVYDLERDDIFSPAISPLVLKQKKKVVVVQKTPGGQKVLITGIPIFNEVGEIEFIISYSYEISDLLIIQDYLKELKHEMLLAKEELTLLRQENLVFDGLILESRSTRQAYESARKASTVDVSVNIFGEYGSGKSTMAKFIHAESNRSAGPFIEIDCETIPEALFEQKLFGVHDEKIGLLALANGGTLYLKGVDKLSPILQGKLAQVLKEKHYTSLHSNEQLPIDVRVISSSETKLIELPSFQKDLYYLLHIVPIELKALRERKEDLSALLLNYVERFSEKYSTERKLSDEVFNHLLHLEWTGNHYELINVIERLVVQSTSTLIKLDDLPSEYRTAIANEQYNIGLEGGSLPSILDSVEKKVLINAQKRYITTTEMAKALGISQPTVVRKLQKYTENA